MKLKLFSKLATKPGGRKVVRASARAARADEEYYEAEPNMKLSHAFMVVLVLHVVAVGGIWAFNQLNSGKKAADLIPALSGKAPLASQPAAPSEPVVATRQPGDADDPLPTVGSQPPAATKPQPRIPGASSVSTTAVAATSAAVPAGNKASTVKQEAPATSADGTYTVAKGDNPYKIAKKLGVSYQTLLEVNKIEDPTKLQIGAVLKVPAKKN